MDVDAVCASDGGWMECYVSASGADSGGHVAGGNKLPDAAFVASLQKVVNLPERLST